MSGYKFVVCGNGVPLGIYDSREHAIESIKLTFKNLSPLFRSDAPQGTHGHWEYECDGGGYGKVWLSITAVLPSASPGNMLAPDPVEV